MASLDKEMYEVMQYTGSVFASVLNSKEERRERWVAKEKAKREKEKREEVKPQQRSKIKST